MNYDERYAEARKKEDYTAHILNEKFARLAEDLVAKGYKKGSVQWEV